MKSKINYHAIGYISTPFKTAEGMPIQSMFSKEKGEVLLDKKYSEAINGLEEFSHLYLIYHFHQAKEFSQKVKPFLSKKIMGLFAVRAPNRPNPIGISVVRLKQISQREDKIILEVEGVDMLDMTPLLDIKPYIDDFDVFLNTKNGWYSEREKKSTESDSRFIEK